MRKPDGYDAAEARETGFREPPAGPYILGIVRAVSQKSAKQNEQIILELDIAEGSFKNHFRKKGEKFNGNFYLKHYQNTEGLGLPFFKGMICEIEKSNPGYVFDFNEATLSRKLIGANLREEQYLKRSGETGANLKAVYLCSVQSIREGGHKVYPPKLLEPRTPGDDFEPPPPDNFNQTSPKDDLPF
jgi:hypothetical protein